MLSVTSKFICDSTLT